jgi:hypothetical protein
MAGMGRWWIAVVVGLVAGTACGQAPVAPAGDAKPLPPARELILDLDRNMRGAEAQRADYTYRVHIERVELDGKGNVKKTLTADSDSVTVNGVRVDRVVARGGKPLTPDEAKKESERIDKEVAKAKERQTRLEDKGKETDARGDELLTASRILELGSFTNERREVVNGRPTIVFDYAGDPKAKLRNRFEGIVKDLVGTVWVDEQDRVLTRAQGHFLNDFKVGAGLVLDIHKGLSFEARYTKVNGEAWLPAEIDGEGSARIMLVDGVNGRFKLVTSDYRKFRATSTIVGTNGVVGPDGHPEPHAPAGTPPPER